MPGRLSPTETALLRDFVERLRAALPSEAIDGVYLFGSRARGHSHETSDLDVAVEFTDAADAARFRYVVADCAHDAMWERDALELGLAAVALPPGPRTGLRDAIARDGIDLWRAPPW
jgi:hypothetical protein